MIIGLLTGRAGSADQVLPFKNIYPVLGRPVMMYPYLAAKKSKLIDDIYLSTDGEEIKQVGRENNIKIIDRPPEFAASDSQHNTCINHALDVLREQGVDVSIVVILMCNVPIQPEGIIDRCIEELLDDESLDTVCTVREWGDHHPSRAKTLDINGFLVPILDEEKTNVTTTRQLLGDCYYLDHQVWAFRVRDKHLPDKGQTPWYWMGDKIKGIENTDLVVDIHNKADVKYGEMWLKANGWEEP